MLKPIRAVNALPVLKYAINNSGCQPQQTNFLGNFGGQGDGNLIQADSNTYQPIFLIPQEHAIQLFNSLL